VKKRITKKPAGISVLYVECESCPEIRPGETPLFVQPGKQCAHCYGIVWMREWRKQNPERANWKPKVKAKVKKRKKVAVK